MKLKFIKPTKDHGELIATWKYGGEYSFYDNDKTESKQEWAKNIDKEENTFVIYDENNELIGNCSFDYEDGEFMLGVQRKQYKFNKIELLVAKFNKRAIKVYKRQGFIITEEFMWNVNNEDKEFISMKRVW